MLICAKNLRPLLVSRIVYAATGISMSVQMDKTRWTFLRPAALAGLFVLGAVIISCGNNTDTSSKPISVSLASSSKLLRLTPEELLRAEIKTIPVTRGQLRIARDYPATIRANENELAEVTALIGGRVEKVHVDVGADVKKGTLLVVLHSTDLGLAQSAYLKASARLHEANLAYQRAKELHEAKAVSLAELLRREAEMKTIQAESRESQNRLKLLGVVDQELERLDREHTIKAEVPIRAPFAGRVIMRNLTRGEVVDPQRILFTIANLSDVWVVANVPEKDVGFIRKNEAVDFIAAAYPHAFFKGSITYVGDVLDPATRTLKVRVTAPNPEMRLKPEMYALVRLYAEVDPELLTIPLESIQNGPAGKVVFVQRSHGEYEIRPVRLGDEYGDVVIVLDGLSPGELVVTKGSFVLKSEMERNKIEPGP